MWLCVAVGAARNGPRRIAIGMTDSKQPSETGTTTSQSKEKPHVPIEHRPLLGVPEAAALTGLTEANIRLAIRRGDLIACYAYTTIKRIRRRDLDDWLASLPENPE